MLWDFAWVCALCWVDSLFRKIVFVFVYFFLSVFTLLFFINLFLAFVCRKSKNLINIVEFCHKHVFPCTFVLMALCIYEHSLNPIHLYHCGRYLDIYVIVVNRSLNLSWMISQWSCWSWDMHRLLPIYLPTCLFCLFV